LCAKLLRFVFMGNPNVGVYSYTLYMVVTKKSDLCTHPRASHPQCRDVSWNVLKKAGSWYMPHGFTNQLDGFAMRSVSRAGFLRTFHETSLHCVYSLVDVYTNPKLELYNMVYARVIYHI
jgi:hypothetical protein